MLAPSMLTRQISGGGGARRLWRAQTNPYADQNLARARLAAHADTPLSTLLTHFLTLHGSLCFTVRSSKPAPNFLIHLCPSVFICGSTFRRPTACVRYSPPARGNSITPTRRRGSAPQPGPAPAEADRARGRTRPP